MRNLKPMLMIVLATVMICGVILGNYQAVFAEENKEGDSEIVSGTVYQFGEKGNYILSDAEDSSTTDSGTVSGGQLSITGNIGSINEKNGFPEFSVKGGTLTF